MNSPYIAPLMHMQCPQYTREALFKKSDEEIERMVQIAIDQLNKTAEELVLDPERFSIAKTQSEDLDIYYELFSKAHEKTFLGFLAGRPIEEKLKRAPFPDEIASFLEAADELLAAFNALAASLAELEAAIQEEPSPFTI